MENNNIQVLGKRTHGVALEKGQPYLIDSGTSQQKRRRIAATAKVWDVESEQEEHSLSLSQHSSPSQSDQEQTPSQKPNPSVMDSQRFNRFKMINKAPSTCQYDNFSSNKGVMKNCAQISQQDLHILDRKETRHQVIEQKHAERGHKQHMIGAEVRGKVDGAFDSGLLMTASVNGRIFRGVLFAPGAGVPELNCSFSNQPVMNSNHVEILRESQQVTTCSRSSEAFCGLRQPLLARPSPMMRGTSASLPEEHKIRSDLQGLVLTLGGPASGN